MRAWALSIDSEAPRCSDQPKESSAAHANVVVAIAIFPRLSCLMAFLHYYLPLFKILARYPLYAAGVNDRSGSPRDLCYALKLVSRLRSRRTIWRWLQLRNPRIPLSSSWRSARETGLKETPKRPPIFPRVLGSEHNRAAVSRLL